MLKVPLLLFIRFINVIPYNAVNSFGLARLLALIVIYDRTSTSGIVVSFIGIILMCLAKTKTEISNVLICF